MRECGERFGTSQKPVWRRLKELGIERRTNAEHFIGKKQSQETICKRVATRKKNGKRMSQEARNAIGRAHLGMHHTEEAKAKISAAMKGRWVGVDNHLWRGGHSLRYDPVTEKAHNRIRLLKRTGRMSRSEPCEVCGKAGECHHDDYNNTDEIRWLCPKHHREFHFHYVLTEDYRFIPQ